MDLLEATQAWLERKGLLKTFQLKMLHLVAFQIKNNMQREVAQGGPLR